MTVSAAEWRAARARADAEKALAKQRFSELRAAVTPAALVARTRQKVAGALTDASRRTEAAVRYHPAAAASLLVGTGLTVASKPIGASLAELYERVKASSAREEAGRSPDDC